MNRTVELLELPTGHALLGVLPRLAEALAGTGPALAPVAAGDTLRVAELGAAFDAGRPLGADEDDPADPTALVLATSGSTGPPKGALLPRSALAASAAATQRRLGPPGHWLLALPAQHIAGLQVLLRSVATGSVPTVLDTGMPFTSERFRLAVRSMPDGPRYLSLVPTQLHRLLLDPAATRALQEFSAVLVGGSATPEPLRRRAREAGVAIVVTYGMSETCGGCVYDGVPLDGVSVELAEESRVLLRGPVVGRGYRGLAGHPAFAVPGTFRTDDVGVVTDGALQILGRVDEVLVTGGLKVAPALLEAAIGGLPGVESVIVVGVPDEEWGTRVVAVLTSTGAAREPDLAGVRQACTAAGIPAALHPRQLLVVDDLPQRGPGKPDRTAVQRAVLAGPPRPSG